MNLSKCIPTHKGDLAAAHQAEMAGFPVLNDILGDLLPWVKDPTWPVAEKLVPLLTGADMEIAPHLMAIFASHDEDWKMALLVTIAPKLKPGIQKLLAPTLDRMATTPTDTEAAATIDEAAKLVLAAWSAQDP